MSISHLTNRDLSIFRKISISDGAGGFQPVFEFIGIRQGRISHNATGSLSDAVLTRTNVGPMVGSSETMFAVYFVGDLEAEPKVERGYVIIDSILNEKLEVIGTVRPSKWLQYLRCDCERIEEMQLVEPS